MDISRVTSQSQTSVPAAVRKQLGISPGSTLEWIVEDGRAIVRRRGTTSFEEMHKKLFPNGPPKPTSMTKNEMIELYILGKFGPKKKIARR